jgi:hypothetical protein
MELTEVDDEDERTKERKSERQQTRRRFSLARSFHAATND